MQRLLSLKQLASKSNFLKNPTNFTFSKPFTCHPNVQKRPLSSFSKHPFHPTFSWRSQQSLSLKTHAFLFNPLLARRFFTSLLSSQLRKSFFDGKVLFFRAQFPERSFASFRYRWRSWLRQYGSSEVVYGLIIANTAVFMLWRIADPKFMANNFTISLDNFLSGRLHTLITSAFSHIDVEHIVSNMIGLYFFGMSRQGMWVVDPSRTPALGASGAVNAIMLLDIFLNPKATLYFDFFIPVPAFLLGVFLIGKDMLRIIEGNSNISGSAHLGGAAVAALAWARIRRRGF
ncbi:RHOMBOID-like protein 12 [Citrus sinensis]|uniref:RHOMBOID-like protein 12, mitochondrial isoform X4 n=1 Tax=Citrus sinensis TaxID=2711 RepID=UPI00219C5A0D|nr:RHOMBOID-like protein 12, mitochondrial isoform X4 [Citrus sinensis]KAH9722240.1 RHOMBOID-like protein 12 [Citrus sinensis]